MSIAKRRRSGGALLLGLGLVLVCLGALLGGEAGAPPPVALPRAVAAKAPTVAVMPFRDLSGGTRFVGEAIRETVTADLRQFGALRVVERGSLDKVLVEQGLQQQKGEMDVATVVKLGKVVGASLILVGAYQRQAPQVRLTARFIKVETSEVIGTAKVDGSSREFLRLQDRVTSALLQSAGFPVHAKRIIDDADKRPELANLQTLEYYGQALTADNDLVRRQFLGMAVASDQNFSYAAKDLAELEKRIREYTAAARLVQGKEIQALQESLRTTTDSKVIESMTSKMVALMVASHRYYATIREARAFLESLPAGAVISQDIDSIALNMITAAMFLKDNDTLLRDGERFLKRAPGSRNFDAIKSYMNVAIAAKRRRESGAAEAEHDVAQSGEGEVRWDLCWVAKIYERHEQIDAARRLLDACFKLNLHPRSDYLDSLVNLAMLSSDWKSVATLHSEWRAVNAVAADSWMRSYDYFMPSDE